MSVSFMEAPKAIDDIEMSLVQNLAAVRDIKKHVYTSVMYPLSHMIMANIKRIHADLTLTDIIITDTYCYMYVKCGSYSKYLSLKMVTRESESGCYAFTFGILHQTYKSHDELCKSMFAFLAHGFSTNGFYNVL